MIGSYYENRLWYWYVAKRDAKPFEMSQWEEQWITNRRQHVLWRRRRHSRRGKGTYDARSRLEQERVAAAVGHWRSGEPTETYAVREWDVTAQVKAAGTYRALFRYTSGNHRLDIQWAALVADGKEQSRDAHEGTTGIVHKNNRYVLRLAEYKPGVRYILRANVKSAGGRDSNGAVYFKILPASPPREAKTPHLRFLP